MDRGGSTWSVRGEGDEALGGARVAAGAGEAVGEDAEWAGSSCASHSTPVPPCAPSLRLAEELRDVDDVRYRAT